MSLLLQMCPIMQWITTGTEIVVKYLEHWEKQVVFTYLMLFSIIFYSFICNNLQVNLSNLANPPLQLLITARHDQVC